MLGEHYPDTFIFLGAPFYTEIVTANQNVAFNIVYQGYKRSILVECYVKWAHKYIYYKDILYNHTIIYTNYV